MSQTPPSDVPPTPPGAGLPQDPALAAAVLEIEHHVAESGWDQPSRLYALVPTAELIRQEPSLAEALGIDGDPSVDGSLTPVEDGNAHEPGSATPATTNSTYSLFER